jgi:hypothetical protein
MGQPARACGISQLRSVLRLRSRRSTGSRIGGGARGSSRISGGGGSGIRSGRRRRGVNSGVLNRGRSLGLAAAGTQHERSDKGGQSKFGLHLSIPQEFKEEMFRPSLLFLGHYPNVPRGF